MCSFRGACCLKLVACSSRAARRLKLEAFEKLLTAAHISGTQVPLIAYEVI